MSLPPTIIHLPADHSVDRGGIAPVAIVVHGTGGTDSRSTLQHGDGRGVSINCLIPKSGDLIEMVPDERGANHAGAPSAAMTVGGRTYRGGQINRVTLGLELENLQKNNDPYPDIQLLSAGWKIAAWRKRFGPLPIFRHADIDPSRRSDPVHLSVAQIEAWVLKAAGTSPSPVVSDSWARWGSRYPLPVEARTHGIAQLWHENASWLGEARSDETPLGDGSVSVCVFQSGLIYYEKAGGHCTLQHLETRLP